MNPELIRQGPGWLLVAVAAMVVRKAAAGIGLLSEVMRGSRLGRKVGFRALMSGTTSLGDVRIKSA